ncbi:class I SAM-dependent methyltransferase [Alkalihalobacillus pseudalcaliphilus]|uniref:class I SAM-dependent methyltransferase n=1 Tax=Alkalihalobacillus pseudalcaliphilus TaxID=79884 RepID=UPI00064E0589|nr:class I SAM-dependent methyltransferase [Alkalihalobacillus pseudalcaliphilus]KMK75617.1 methyltransferase type 11 [Alkalihalobacillus pseudalcaliphilus]
MSIDFHSKKNKDSYTTREADFLWKETIKGCIGHKELATAVDIGCGGGIYSKALSDIGAMNVIGIDFSKAILEGAKKNCQNYDNISFKFGTALESGLSDESCELVLERALIHHLDTLSSAFKESYRILNRNGYFIIQDRTPEDCFLSGTEEHIRGYFFDLFPRLKIIENKRRFHSEEVFNSLYEAGFKNVQEIKIWETRNIYKEKVFLLDDLQRRTGRSILHELSDRELSRLVEHINKSIPSSHNLIEKDRWSIYIAQK